MYFVDELRYITSVHNVERNSCPVFFGLRCFYVMKTITRILKPLQFIQLNIKYISCNFKDHKMVT